MLNFMIDQLFFDPVIGKAASYVPAGGVGYPVRVILSQPDEIVGFGAGQLQATSTIVEVRVSDVAEPKAGDAVIVGEQTLVIQGEPRADRERLTWRLSAYEA